MNEKKFRYFPNKLNCIHVAAVLIVVWLIIPIPALLLDILMALNLLFALVILLVVLCAKKAKGFSLFPAMVLLSIIYSLTVNISAGRLILIKGADFDGRLIRFASNLVAGSGEIVNVIIGFAIFVTITAFYVLIIVKGAVRVAEVAARFTLDSLPGKFMTIDAAYSSGAIGEKEAAIRKETLQRECDFCGALDGAGKFISGNAKLGIAITASIIVAGTLIDHLLRDYAIFDALETYVSLAIGSGILFIFPGCLISLAVGYIPRTFGSTSLQGGVVD